MWLRNKILRGVVVALTISPADGFISRLIQQTQQSASAKKTDQHPATGAQGQVSKDQTSISSEARQALQASHNQDMESKLIDLYNQKGSRAA